MNDKLKRFIILLSYTLFVIYIYIWGEGYQLYLRNLASQTFNRDRYIVFSYVIFPIVIGLVISLPKFIIEMRKRGKWQIDWIKFIAIGIPVLYLTIFPLVLVFSSQTQGSGLPLLNALYPAPLSFHMPIKLSGVVFGYILLSVPYKVNLEEIIETENVTIND